MRVWTVCAGLCASMAVEASAQVDPEQAEQYFSEAMAICERDAGRLWGISLCGPMVIADWRTRTLATSEPAPAGERPNAIGLANAPIEWDGQRWAAYIWDFVTPLGNDSRARGELFLHELFHRVQPELGLVTESGGNDHLDSVEGRVWLRLEWRALAEALRQSGDDRLRAIRDGLAFRAARRARFADAAENERVEEIREGLAQYTGTVVTATSEADAVASALDQLAAAEDQESFVQAFAYTSGLAYGLLLDALSGGWRQRVRATSDLGALLMTDIGVEPAENVTAAAARYEGLQLRRAEQTRDEQRQALIGELRTRFVDGPVLTVPAGGGGTFDIRGATVIPGVGTVYFSTFTFEGRWGSLAASEGVLVAEDGSRRLPGPVQVNGSVLSGDGWMVTVAPDWVARPGDRPGDYEIVRR